jgi:hypothetical protein
MLARWKFAIPKQVVALRTAQHELAVVESELGYAEVDAQHLALGLGPVVPNQIKARRHALEDLELKIARLLGGPLPAQSYHQSAVPEISGLGGCFSQGFERAD